MDAESEQVIRPALINRKRLLRDDDDDESEPLSSPDTSGDDYEKDNDEEDSEQDDHHEGGADDQELDPPRGTNEGPDRSHGGRRTTIKWKHDDLYQFFKAVEKHGAHKQRIDHKVIWRRVFDELAGTHHLPGGVTKPTQLSKKLSNLLAAKRDPITEPPFTPFKFVAEGLMKAGDTASKKDYCLKWDQAEANHARKATAGRGRGDAPPS